MPGEVVVIGVCHRRLVNRDRFSGIARHARDKRGELCKAAGQRRQLRAADNGIEVDDDGNFPALFCVHGVDVSTRAQQSPFLDRKQDNP